MANAGGRDTFVEAARSASRSMRRGLVIVLACLGVSLAGPPATVDAAEAPEGSPPPAAPAPAPAPAQPPSPETQSRPAPDRRLSNERTSTTWAHPEAEGSIFASPDIHSRRVGYVHMQTEDGFPEVYLLLSEHTDAEGQAWIKVRIPGRPNGRHGWVPRELLGPFHVTHWQIVISLQEHLLTAYYDGHRRFVAPVGVGKPSTPTPSGHFWIRERFRLASPSSPYWPYALGTSDYSTLSEWPGGGVVGIHGDFGEPQLIPGDPSHGCVRMRDPDIAWLGPRVTLGTPVDIVP